MAVNCKSISTIWDWVSKKRLDLTIGEFSLQPLIDQFNTVSGCKLVIPCKEDVPQDCDRDFIYLCNFIIGTINVTSDPQGLTTIGAPIELYLGGVGPYNIVWTWDAAVFTYVAGQGTSAIQLQKINGVPSTTLTTVSVRAHDGAQCKDDGATTFSFPGATVDCSSAAMSPVDSYIGIPYSGTLTIPYAGGNGAAYAGFTIQSTGVPGLTAVLPPGTLATGAGNLIFTVTGTPQGNGNGQFQMNLFSDTPCVVPFGTAETVCSPTQISHVYHPFDFDNNWYPVEINWIPKVDAVSYTLEIQYSIGAPDIVVIPAPANTTFIFVPPGMFFSVSLVVNCFFDSAPVSFSDTAPLAPAPCPIPTNLNAAITNYDPILQQFWIRLQWDIMTGAMAYIVRDAHTGTSQTTGSRIIQFKKPANTALTFGVKVDCGNLVGESPEATVNITTPANPTGIASPWPVLHFMDNVTTGAANSWFMQTWLTVASDTDYVTVRQRSPFYVPPPGGPEFTSDSDILPPGQDNGYGTLPVGFGIDDIFFGTGVAPKGVTLLGSALNFVRVAVVKTPLPFQSTATFFDYWMNVPEQYTIRMSAEDYISTDPSISRPTLSVLYPNPGEANIAIQPFPFNYDTCSKYNLFLVSEAGTILTRTRVGNPTSEVFTGLAPGKYLAFAEITYDACTVFSGNIVTALPLYVNIA